MAATISQFRNRIIPHVPGCPIPAIDQHVVDAMRTYCEDTKIFTKMIGATGETPADELPAVLGFVFAAYPNGDFYIVYIDLTDYTALSGYDPIEITYFSIDGIESEISHMTIDEEVASMDVFVPRDTKFYEFPDKENLEIFPFLTEAETEVTLEITIALKPSDGSTSVDDRFFDEWRKPIIDLAVSNLQSLPGRKWTNYDLAAVNFARYEEEITKINTKRFNRYFKQSKMKTQFI